MAFYKFKLVYILNRPEARAETGVEVIARKMVDVRVEISLLLIRTFSTSLSLPIKARLWQIWSDHLFKHKSKNFCFFF